MQEAAIRLMDRIQPTAAKRSTTNVESTNAHGGAGFEAVFAQIKQAPPLSTEGQVTTTRETHFASGQRSASSSVTATEQSATDSCSEASSNPKQNVTIHNHREKTVDNASQQTATLDGRSFVSGSIARSAAPTANQMTASAEAHGAITLSANVEALLGAPAEAVGELPNVVQTGNMMRSTAGQAQTALAQLAWRDHYARVVSEVQVRQPSITEDAWETAMPKSGLAADSAELARPVEATREVIAQRTSPVHQPAATTSKGQSVSTTTSPAGEPAETRPASELEPVRTTAENATPTNRSTNEIGALVRPAAEAMKVPVSIATPAGTRVAVRVAEVQALMDQVSHQMTARVNEGGGTVRLRLDPPELGSLRLEVQVDQNSVRAQALVETARARTLLVESLPQLRQVMAEQGLHLEQFSVTDQPVDQQFAWSGQFQNDQAEARERGSNPFASETAPAAVDETNEAPNYRLRGLSGNIRVTA